MPKFPQWVFDQNYLQKRLAAKGTKPDSGSSIIQPGIYQVGKGGAFDPYDTFDISAEDQVTAAEFNWKYYEVPITISRDEILKNQGKEGVRKLMDAKMKGAAMKMSDLLATDTLAIDNNASTSTFGTDSSTTLNCLDNAINNAADDLGTGVTYGGIAKDTYTWWAGHAYDGGGDTTNATYAGVNSMWYKIADGNIQPTLLLSHNNTLAGYLAEQQAYQRYIKQDTADSGFLAIEVNGRPWAADLHVSDSTTEEDCRMYFLNEDFLDFVVHRDENNRLEPFAKPVDQAVIVAHIMFAGELTCSDPSRQGCVYDFDSIDHTADNPWTLA
jgi:hypothetical protein